MIRTTSYSQDQILGNILKLLGVDRFELDPTYSTGGFYKGKIPEPRLKYDISPARADVIKADCRHLPLFNESVKSVIFDPPFLATTGPSLRKKDNGNNILVNHFGLFPNEQTLYKFYQESLREFHRILSAGGFLIFKCQDKVSSGKQYFSHCFVWQVAQEEGFYPKDLFVLLAKNRVVANWQRNQQHARKYHAYFWVFEKGRKKVRYV